MFTMETLLLLMHSKLDVLTDLQLFLPVQLQKLVQEHSQQQAQERMTVIP